VELESNITESTEKLDYVSMALGLTPDIAVMTYSLAQKGINKYDLPELARKIEEKHRSSNSILLKIDTTSNRDSANSKKPPLVSEESNASSNNDKRSDLGDTQVKTHLLSSSDCCPKQKRIENVVRGGKTSPESHQLVSNQGAQNCGRSQQETIKKGDLTKVVSTKFEDCKAANPAAIDPANMHLPKLGPLVYSEGD
jgi:hypothetical protein